MKDLPTLPYSAASAADMVTALRTAREERGWSLRQVAAEVGTTASAVMYWEHGKRMPTLVKAIAWAEVLGYDLRLQRPARQPDAATDRPWRDPADCSGCRCCPNGACEPGEPLGPGVCGHTCPCHPDFYREETN